MTLPRQNAALIYRCGKRCVLKDRLRFEFEEDCAVGGEID